jgi:hypothetical protein
VHDHESPTGKKGQDGSQKKEKPRRHASPVSVSPHLLNQEETQEKQSQDEGSRGLSEDSFLAEEIPAELESEIKNDELIENLHSSFVR